MVDWLGHEATNIPMIEKWLAVCGLTLADYLAHLRNRGTSDGLELWAFSLATNKPITIVQESSVWSMSVQGTDFQQIIVTMTSYTSGSLCTEEQSEAGDIPGGAEGVADPSFEPQALLLKRSGRPLILPMDSPSSLSDDLSMTTSTDPEDCWRWRKFGPHQYPSQVNQSGRDAQCVLRSYTLVLCLRDICSTDTLWQSHFGV